MGSPARLLLLLSCLTASAWEATSPSETGEERPGLGRTSHLQKLAAERRLSAGFLAVKGVYNTELTAPYDVLEHASHHAPEGLGIDLFTVSPEGETVTLAERLRILPDHGFDDCPPIENLVVPSASREPGQGPGRPEADQLGSRDPLSVANLCGPGQRLRDSLSLR